LCQAGAAYSCTSSRLAVIVLAISCTSTRAMGSARSTKSALMRRNTLTRSMSGVAAQSGWAAPAAATARSTSAGEHLAISFTSSPEYGERTSKVPALPSTHRPPMRASLGRADALSTTTVMSISSL